MSHSAVSHVNAMIEADTPIAAQSSGRFHWLTIGEGIGALAIFLGTDAATTIGNVDRLRAALDVLRAAAVEQLQPRPASLPCDCEDPVCPKAHTARLGEWAPA